jgi:hypothetical protein
MRGCPLTSPSGRVGGALRAWRAQAARIAPQTATETVKFLILFA